MSYEKGNNIRGVAKSVSLRQPFVNGGTTSEFKLVPQQGGKGLDVLATKFKDSFRLSVVSNPLSKETGIPYVSSIHFNIRTDSRGNILKSGPKKNDKEQSVFQMMIQTPSSDGQPTFTKLNYKQFGRNVSQAFLDTIEDDIVGPYNDEERDRLVKEFRLLKIYVPYKVDIVNEMKNILGRRRDAVPATLSPGTFIGAQSQ